MDLHKLKDIFERYHRGASNETENALVEAWYNSYKPDENQLSESALREVTYRLSKNIYASTSVKPTLYSRPILWLAAGVMLFLGAGISWFLTSAPKPSYNLVITKTRDVKKIALSDGSTLWLNSSSRVRIPSIFSGVKREILMEEGEAFFEIKKDPGRPFVVHTPNLDVQVLGTSFNVRAYQQSHNVRVSVQTGKVAVSKATKAVATLTPGQQVDFDTKDATATISLVNIEELRSWQTGITHLKNASFNELALVIKSIYGTSIKAGNKKVAAYHFNMQLMHSLSADKVMELISQIHQTKFRKEGNAIVFY